MYRSVEFVFEDNVDRNILKRDLDLAIVVTECVYGKDRTWLSVDYSISDVTVLIGINDDVGLHIATVFSGMVSRHLGEEAFDVCSQWDR
jgi:hypothetical protein